VGFHADPSDIKIPFELIDLTHDIELLTACLFETNAFAEHEYADFVSFFYTDICKPHGIENGFAVFGGNDKQNFHFSLRLQVLSQKLLHFAFFDGDVKGHPLVIQKDICRPFEFKGVRFGFLRIFLSCHWLRL
jgi:hypothetical protein